MPPKKSTAQDAIYYEKVQSMIQKAKDKDTADRAAAATIARLEKELPHAPRYARIVLKKPPPPPSPKKTATSKPSHMKSQQFRKMTPQELEEQKIWEEIALTESRKPKKPTKSLFCGWWGCRQGGTRRKKFKKRQTRKYKKRKNKRRKKTNKRL